jgi:hypothetical protein
MTITIKQEQILGYVLPGIGIIMTIIRLFIRKRSGRLGLDDAAIAIASIAQVNLMIATNLYTDASIPTGPRKVGFFYWTGQSFYVIIRFSRLSILLSIRRIVPSFTWRRFCTMAAVLLVMMFTALTIQFYVTCETKHGWKQLVPLPQCPLGKSVAYTMLALDIIGDMTIIVLPALFIWRSTLPTQKRIGLIAAFAVSILTSIVGFSHVHYILAGPPLVENLNGILQCSISVIACNLPILIFTTMSMTNKEGTNIDEEAEMDEATLQQKTRGGVSTLTPTLNYNGDVKKDSESDAKESA